MMIRRGFTAVVVYLDDFFICAPTLDECNVAMNTLVALLRRLGFSINWDKVIDPTRCLTFLGIEIDTATMVKRLPSEKVLALKAELEVFAKGKRASKRQLQSLAGKLHWAAGVVYGGRVFVRRILDAICTLRSANHKCVLTLYMRRDIQWWKEFMHSFNGMSLIINKGPDVIVHTDACDVGAGGYCEGDYFYCNWSVDLPAVQDSHINFKELAAVVLAAQRWGPLWANKHVVVLSDNSTTVTCINRGSSRSVLLMKYLRHIFWLSAVFNFRLKAVPVVGDDNVLADRISRLHEPEARQYLTILLALSPLSWHVSYNGGFCIFWTGPGFLDTLDDKVRWLQEQVFAPSTRVTYASQCKLYQHLCALGDINPVPLSQDNACRYIAFLSQKLAYTSIKQCCSYNASGSRSCKPLSALLAHRHAAQRYTKNISDCT
jgi:hypothetical protein